MPGYVYKQTTLWLKEIMLISSIFSFFYDVVKSICPKVIRSPICLTLYDAILTFNDKKKVAFENIVGNGENSGNQYFLLFPTMFSTLDKFHWFKLFSVNALSLDNCTFLLFSEGLSRKQLCKR